MRLSVAVAAGLILVGIVVAALLFAPRDLEQLQAAMASAGVLAPLLFIGLQVIATIGPIPRTAFTLAAGVLFGAAVGIVVAVVATVAAAMVAFVLVRTVGRDYAARYTGAAPVQWVDRRLSGRGTMTVLSLRLLPALPFAVLNYSCGLSSVRPLPYVFGTFVGVLPGTIAVVTLGDAVTGTVSPAMLAVSVVFGLIGVLGVVLAGRVRPDARVGGGA
jgi:uncharacterized membrane protein YdjX (TVP38/TMEM64 family)